MAPGFVLGWSVCMADQSTGLLSLQKKLDRLKSPKFGVGSAAGAVVSWVWHL